MAPGAVLKSLCFLWLLAQTAFSMPSFDHGSFDDGSLLAFGSVLHPRSEPYEIRGVYGGRKKRFIVEREEPNSCSKECKEKIICMPTIGMILKDCKCQKCPTGVPTIDGKSCQDDCPQGQEKNDQGGCCPIGQKPKQTGDGCEAKDDKDSDRKGKCPGDTVLDLRQGSDSTDANPRCQIDDEKKCPKPKVPGTRPEGKENDAAFQVECGEPDKDESKKPKCDSKTQYTHVMVDSEGKAVQSCKQTRKFYNRKGTKPTNSDVRAKIKDSWNKLKPDYDKKNQERQNSLKKLKEIQEERDRSMKEKDDKIKEANDKKKERLAKCDTPIALLLGAAFNEAMSKRDGEHPYDWTTDYFDEEFVGSDERLKDWPQDIDVEQISADVDTEAFLKKWDEYIDDHKRQGHSCTFIGKRSLDRRCSQRRSLEEWYGGVDLDTRFDNTSALVQRHVGPVFHADISLRDIATLPHGMHELDKRNPIAWLFEILAQFGTRMAVQVAARATASVAANSPRLANLLKTPERLFQTAAKGQGTKAGQKGMEGAKEAIKKDAKRYWKCLKEGKP